MSATRKPTIARPIHAVFLILQLHDGRARLSVETTSGMVDSYAPILYFIGAGFQIIAARVRGMATRPSPRLRRFTGAKSGEGENYLLACGNFEGPPPVWTSRSKFFLKSSWTASSWDSCTP